MAIRGSRQHNQLGRKGTKDLHITTNRVGMLQNWSQPQLMPGRAFARTSLGALHQYGRSSPFGICEDYYRRFASRPDGLVAHLSSECRSKSEWRTMLMLLAEKSELARKNLPEEPITPSRLDIKRRFTHESSILLVHRRVTRISIHRETMRPVLCDTLATEKDAGPKGQNAISNPRPLTLRAPKYSRLEDRKYLAHKPRSITKERSSLLGPHCFTATLSLDHGVAFE